VGLCRAACCAHVPASTMSAPVHLNCWAHLPSLATSAAPACTHLDVAAHSQMGLSTSEEQRKWALRICLAASPGQEIIASTTAVSSILPGAARG
jgi:hypothetical protein